MKSGRTAFSTSATYSQNVPNPLREAARSPAPKIACGWLALHIHRGGARRVASEEADLSDWCAVFQRPLDLARLDIDALEQFLELDRLWNEACRGKVDFSASLRSRRNAYRRSRSHGERKVDAGRQVPDALACVAATRRELSEHQQ